MSNAIVAFNSEFSVTFDTAKGVTSISVEGALVKGGKALASLKDVAVDSALAKAVNGRYTAAVDVLETAFPKVVAAVRTLHGVPALNKFNFMCVLSGIENAAEPAKGFSKRQLAAQSMVRTLRNVPALAKAADERAVIEMA